MIDNVKFFIKRESVAVSLNDLEEDLKDVLDKFFEGNYTVIEKLNED